MEMVQFHPTVFPGGPGLLISEAALAEGGEIVNQQGQPIVEAKFEPRERLSRSIYQALQNGAGSAFLDLRPLGDKLASSLPQTCELVQAVAGLDATKQPVPIYPAAHRSIGGIAADLDGHTSIKGLFAAGECACNGLNGAGRLAGNTLTEALVFGRRTGEAAASYARGQPKKNPLSSSLNDEERRLSSLTTSTGVSASADSPSKIQAELGKLMNSNAGLVREASSLQVALDQVGTLKDRYSRIRLSNSSLTYNYQLTSYLELGSLLNIAELVIMAAQARRESRGAHYRTDFPTRDDSQWKRHTTVSQAGGTPRIDTEPVSSEAQSGRV
jgi:succinate dehydrogenase / fumarate reductase flavoprotein subunit